jgi:septum site-determining protein MinC
MGSTPVTATARVQHSISFRGRSLLSFVLTPQRPLDGWIGDLEEWLRRSPGFFRSKPVLLDLSAAAPDKGELDMLVKTLNAQGVRIMALDGVEEALCTPDLPPRVTGGRPASAASLMDPAPRAETVRDKPATLLVEEPVRSGATLFFPDGDVTVIGSVASGAEIIAGGSIHIYGALRGRALAGMGGLPGARIFCNRFEAELLAIDGTYRTADELDAGLRGRAVQARRNGADISITTMD